MDFENFDIELGKGDYFNVKDFENRYIAYRITEGVTKFEFPNSKWPAPDVITLDVWVMPLEKGASVEFYTDFKCPNKAIVSLLRTKPVGACSVGKVIRIQTSYTFCSVSEAMALKIKNAVEAFEAKTERKAVNRANSSANAARKLADTQEADNADEEIPF